MSTPNDAVAEPKQHGLVNYRPLAVCIAMGAAIWFCPVPEGVTTEGWHLLAIFAATILGLMIKPLPMGGLAMISMMLAVLTNTIDVTDAFNAFSNKTVWLVVFALFIAKGFSVTGLGRRIAYCFTYLLGRTSLGLGYGIVATDLIIAPATPSVTGRIGGIVFPIIQGIAHSYKSYPHCKSAKKIGAYLTVTAFQGCVITSCLFLTAMAANPILQKLTNEQNVQMGWHMPEVTWGSWALATLVPGIISLLVVPLIIYWIYPPEIKQTPDAPSVALEHLKELGKMRFGEWMMLFTIGVLLILWIFGGKLGVDATIAGMVGVAILKLTRVLDWKTLTKMDSAWETFVWFSILIMLAGGLKDYGVIAWFGNIVQTQFTGVDWKLAFPALTLIYFYSHYAFASSTAHVFSMYIPFLTISVALGTPPMLAALVLIFSSNLYGGLTHYSLSPAPLLYGAGYVDIKDWWKIGLIVSLVNILIWGTIGLGWWKILGLW